MLKLSEIRLKKIFIFITLIIITQSSPSLSGEPCIGWEENTENLVLGDCSSDIFIGYVKKTFSNVSGACYDGILSAWNNDNGNYVWGDCSNEYIPTYKKYGLKKFK